MTNPVPVTLFAKARGCQQCVATKKHLDRQGTPYSLRYVDEDPAAADWVKLLGYQAVPVVMVGDMHWSGYRDDKLTELQRLHTVAADIADLDETAAAAIAEENVA